MKKVRIHGSYDRIVMGRKKKGYKCPVCGKKVSSKGTCSWECWKKLYEEEERQNASKKI